MFLGVGLALLSPSGAENAGLLGDVFVGALKAIAPILIFIMVIVAIATKPPDTKTNIKSIVAMYAAGTFLAAITAVMASVLFPTELVLATNYDSAASAPLRVADVLKTVLFNIIDNPIKALANANFLGVLAWGIGIGIAFHHSSSERTKTVLKDLSGAVLILVRAIIRMAPFGIFGIMAKTFAETGFGALASYGHLLLVLVGAMLFTMSVINPIIMFAKSHRNPYPLIWLCIKESAVTAFFTRSSAANTPINLTLCKKMQLNEDTYSISIPLGSVLNMSGAAVTVTTFSLAAAHTLGIEASFGSMIFLCFISALAACGTSGVAGGSILLIPLACSLFSIPNDAAMQVVAIGFIVGVVQDSFETALNSSTDVMFTAAASKKTPVLDFENSANRSLDSQV
ncbi:serine/threonine transporter SstT [Fibrobacterales bacterium]|nr:serine/threonine transporter SstT [Fibrobacterales bacterium]